MKIAIINPIFSDSSQGNGQWITVPPRGYGGIQWVVANIISALLDRGHTVTLYGAPGSPGANENLRVSDATDPQAMHAGIVSGEYDVVHDFSNGLMAVPEVHSWGNFITTYSLTGSPRFRRNVVFLSFAQRIAAGYRSAPVCRIPIDRRFSRFVEGKADYLLFLGRVSPWKGVLEAARFADACRMKLKIAGPVWEPEYFTAIVDQYGQSVEYIGEVCGDQRLQLLSEARALLAMSQSTLGPWDSPWCEPGSTVVSEAAVCGTPVISTDNGCLAEITPHVGIVIPEHGYDYANSNQILENLPSPNQVRAAALREWASDKIVREYEELYRRILAGDEWHE